MSAPRTKRPFAGASSDPAQRQITSFFAPRSGPAPPSETSSTLTTNKLPPDVQSNLLSVGMRVRKSVPEGYKTGTYKSVKLSADTAEPRTPVVRTTNPASNRNTAAASQRELLPFCGINKVGGLASQPTYASESEHEAEGVPGLDDLPGLSSSQESVESTASDGRSKKRFFIDEETDEPVQVWANHTAWLDSEVSPRSLAPSGFANARPFAVPRKSHRKSMAGQENLVVDDFDDADFLVSPDTDMSDA
ncbi:ribonucleotide reductase inhibitor [Colletotrichum graminicola]|uniref:Ribonucleotide reductase inhibitor n=1 Tax=Colletotrichum graminicola (strain M1.001 / M2 / FGSC 10212) TaxID=645133 RepID=E3QVT3_COLGM|nr:ribonucleotide reductase inhibitor [Colletotrichum graminicola M1.001]EFQ34971.1 ribonucleotide reductase inhibitor [Colletotrichum graminicola M1.001]WDK18193.1 ribonucleotide reductase inhibitor [Colletotrichum graminicola]